MVNIGVCDCAVSGVDVQAGGKTIKTLLEFVDNFLRGWAILFGKRKECAMCEGVGEYRIGVYSYWCRFCNGIGKRKWWH